MEKTKMREEYDFSNAVKNPYVGKLKQQITIRLDEQVLASGENNLQRMRTISWTSV